MFDVRPPHNWPTSDFVSKSHASYNFLQSFLVYCSSAIHQSSRPAGGLCRLMRRTHLLRWSGTVLTPRTRPNSCLSITFAIQSRNAATATAYANYTPGIDKPVEPSPYESLPSPPPEASRKSARLAALHARLYLSSRIPLETLGRCLVDSTADRHDSFNNSSLAILGNDVLAYHTSELILCRYPRLPSAVILASTSAYIGPYALSDLAKSWGVEAAAVPGGEVDAGLLQFRAIKSDNSESEVRAGVLEKEGKISSKSWKRGVSSLMKQDDFFGEITGREILTPVQSTSIESEYMAAGPGSTYQGACTNFVRAVFGAVYVHAGRQAAKNFFNAHIASRKLEVSKMFVFRAPERDLARLCAREGFEPPVARMISETGRLSVAPVFNVGVFSGKEKLGEATGASLQEARFRAAVSALKGWYLYSPLQVQVPSDVEGDGSKEWTPVLVDGGEVVW